YGTLPATAAVIATRGRPGRGSFRAAQPEECRDESFRLNRAIRQSRSNLGVWVLYFLPTVPLERSTTCAMYHPTGWCTDGAMWFPTCTNSVQKQAIPRRSRSILA